MAGLARLCAITGLAPDLLDFVEETGFRLGKHRVSLLLVMQTMPSIATALLLLLWLGDILKGLVMAATGYNVVPP